ncbi:MAG: phosphatase PAP2 family protein [Christensenellaceae bacterium]|jgi:membrane-associated phospholipid phosphatase|nr:phosphatase PAP2 family protein [Christensenellaceae bacterium]
MELLLPLEGLRSPALDAFFMAVTQLGGESALLAAVLLLYWCVDKRAGLHLALIYFVSGLFGQLLKLCFLVPRPFVLDARLQPVKEALPTATGYSFPSGHAAAAGSLAVGLGAWLKRRWVWVLALLYALLVGFSRLYLGVHSLRDVLCGLVLAALAARLVTALEGAPNGERWIFRLGLCGAALLCAFALLRSTLGVPPEMTADALKTAGAAFGLLLGWRAERRFVRFEAAAPPLAQALKLLSGLLIAVGLKEGLAALLGAASPFMALGYAVLVFYLVAGHPFFFQKAMEKAKKAKG